MIFSDRLIQTGMVTMTSLCRHPSPLTVLVFTRFIKDYEPLPIHYLQCRVLTLSLADALEHLTRIGWQPETICDPPGVTRLGKATEATLVGTLSWDKDYKHASCANHLRFYLPEFPILRRHARMMFVDDDVVIMKDAVQTLYHRQLPPGILLPSLNRSPCLCRAPLRLLRRHRVACPQYRRRAPHGQLRGQLVEQRLPALRLWALDVQPFLRCRRLPSRRLAPRP